MPCRYFFTRDKYSNKCLCCLILQNNPVGHSGLGLMYLYGKGVDQVINQNLHFCNHICNLKDVFISKAFCFFSKMCLFLKHYFHLRTC